MRDRVLKSGLKGRTGAFEGLISMSCWMKLGSKTGCTQTICIPEVGIRDLRHSCKLQLLIR